MGKGGSSTSVEIPDYIENAARNNLQRADFVSKLGYVPQSFGPTVAAFTPMQQSAFGNTAQAADAFGLGAPTGADVFGGMGEPTTYADGIRAYSAAPLFNQTMDAFAAARPGQFNAINSMFIDPFGYNPAGTFDMGSLVDINSTPVIDDTTTTTTTTTSGGGGGGSSTTPTNVIATVPVDEQTGNFYQDNQLFNPDINYDDARVASNNQIVGVLDPTDKSLAIVNEAYGIDPSFYTDSPIYSASDFPVGSSATATDFTVYSDDNNNNTATNQFGSTVSVGYGVGQVDPALAAAAGYTSSPAPGVIGNNPTGENSIAQTIANLVTPFDDTTYQGGILQTNEAAAAAKAAEEAAAKEEARLAAKRRRDARKGTGAFAKRPQKTGVGGRNIGGR
jgi:hypothetical protein